MAPTLQLAFQEFELLGQSKTFPLVDLPLRGGEFMCPAVKTGFVSFALWLETFSDSNVTVFPRSIFDHWLLVLDTLEESWGPFPFQFEFCLITALLSSASSTVGPLL